MVGPDSGTKADGGKVARFGDVDTQFRCFHINLARFNLGTKSERTHIYIFFSRQRQQYILVGQDGEIDVHFILPIEFEQLF